jgi:pimeloyl-ACP methyl ester carboxylesterase
MALDCRGHGSSGKPHTSDAYDGNQMADDVIAVMDAAGLERADLMGYSMGARIAMNLLARYPDRFSSVVIGGAGLPPGSDAPMRATLAAAFTTDDVSTITDPTALSFRQFAESRKHDPRSIAGLDNDLKALGACYSRYYKELLDEVDVVALRGVQVPVLVVVGDRDEVLASARVLAETVPGAELVLLPGEDHITATTAQSYKDAVASFLTAHSPVDLLVR